MTSPDRPSRPLNCFMIYRLEKQKEVAAAHPGLSIGQISCLLASRWYQLSEVDKEPYRQIAERNKREYAKRYPKYKYKPRKTARPRKYGKTTALEDIRRYFPRLTLRSIEKSAAATAPSPPASVPPPATSHIEPKDAMVAIKAEPKDEEHDVESLLCVRPCSMPGPICAVCTQSVALLCHQPPVPLPMYSCIHQPPVSRSQGTVLLLPLIVIKSSPHPYQLHAAQPRFSNQHFTQTLTL